MENITHTRTDRVLDYRVVEVYPLSRGKSWCIVEVIGPDRKRYVGRGLTCEAAALDGFRRCSRAHQAQARESPAPSPGRSRCLFFHSERRT